MTRATFRNENSETITEATWNQKGYHNTVATKGQCILNALDFVKKMKTNNLVVINDYKTMLLRLKRRKIQCFQDYEEEGKHDMKDITHIQRMVYTIHTVIMRYNLRGG